MFWLLDPAVSTGFLSDDQMGVIQLNPAVQ
jgi:hypothetical protein